MVQSILGPKCCKNLLPYLVLTSKQKYPPDVVFHVA